MLQLSDPQKKWQTFFFVFPFAYEHVCRYIYAYLSGIFAMGNVWDYKRNYMSTRQIDLKITGQHSMSVSRQCVVWVQACRDNFSLECDCLVNVSNIFCKIIVNDNIVVSKTLENMTTWNLDILKSIKSQFANFWGETAKRKRDSSDGRLWRAICQGLYFVW